MPAFELQKGETALSRALHDEAFSWAEVACLRNNRYFKRSHLKRFLSASLCSLKRHRSVCAPLQTHAVHPASACHVPGGAWHTRDVTQGTGAEQLGNNVLLGRMTSWWSVCIPATSHTLQHGWKSTQMDLLSGAQSIMRQSVLLLHKNASHV